MKIVLIGYMGSGKSTIGKLLAKKLDYEFIDLDDYIEERLQTPIPEYLNNKEKFILENKNIFFLRKFWRVTAP